MVAIPYEKTCSMRLVITEMQIKSAMRYLFSPTRWLTSGADKTGGKARDVQMTQQSHGHTEKTTGRCSRS